LSKLKIILFTVSKRFGLFYLSRRLTRRGLRILCYHAFAVDGDECLFRPKLFMRCSTFQRRLKVLKSAGYPVVSLEEAVNHCDAGNLPDCATAITIDDGFPSVYRCGAEWLARFSYPATVYMTTYYSVKQNPVFRLLVQYMFWKTKVQRLSIPQTLCSFSGTFSLATTKEKDKVIDEIIRVGEEQYNESQRAALARALAELLEVNLERIYKDRVFHVMNDEEIRATVGKGIDVQLHSHRHRFPVDEAEAEREIRDNRSVLESLTGKSLRHFCYPSGLWSREHWHLLAKQGIRSAATCDPGLNFPGTPQFALKRLLDSEDVSQIEFEAEMAGYVELLRRIRLLFSSSARMLGSLTGRFAMRAAERANDILPHP
jgi:peptidoglycan/xylan/chitin deacetylase (PgdA/CDA1 family)